MPTGAHEQQCQPNKATGKGAVSRMRALHRTSELFMTARTAAAPAGSTLSAATGGQHAAANEEGNFHAVAPWRRSVGIS